MGFLTDDYVLSPLILQGTARVEACFLSRDHKEPARSYGCPGLLPITARHVRERIVRRIRESNFRAAAALPIFLLTE
jgi:hypothetical protein